MEESRKTFTTLLEHLSDLQTERDTPILFFGSGIEVKTVPVLYKLLQKQGRVKKLDLVLSTNGGSVNTARRLALLLHEYTEHLTILVPQKAKSAGTLLCLAAHQIGLGPLAELSPLDPQIGSEGFAGPAAPGKISAEEIRLFRQMSQEWFAVQSEEHSAQLLSLFMQRIFPTSLSAFYRSEKLMHQIASELLTYQLNKSSEHVRQQIVDQLIHGYYSHEYAITYKEAQKLGLQVYVPSPREEELLWNIQEVFQQIVELDLEQKEFIQAVIANTHSLAREVSYSLSNEFKPSTSVSTNTPGRARAVRDMTGLRWEVHEWRK